MKNVGHRAATSAADDVLLMVHRPCALTSAPLPSSHLERQLAVTGPLTHRLILVALSVVEQRHHAIIVLVCGRRALRRRGTLGDLARDPTKVSAS